jgi:phospholipid/cholesterol/gamma-HCH transport system substrate-binding protein
MDQSQSNNKQQDSKETIKLPKRSFSAEFFVGLFVMVALACAAYLSVGLGGLKLVDSGNYMIYAEFDNISGLQYGASVEIAGVSIGEVAQVRLDDSSAVVGMKIRNDVRIREDDIAAIRTKGIIGDRYVKISRGASEQYVEPGASMLETESVVDIEDIIGKIVHSLGSDEKDEDKEE